MEYPEYVHMPHVICYPPDDPNDEVTALHMLVPNDIELLLCVSFLSI